MERIVLEVDNMKQKLVERLENLRKEHTAGQGMLAQYQRQMMELQQTILRISGAIQVLEEMLKEESQNVAAKEVREGFDGDYMKSEEYIKGTTKLVKER